MALDVWIGEWNDLGSRHFVSFNEAYYCFMIPSIEALHERHGKFLFP